MKRMMLHTEELQCCQKMPRAGEAAGDREPGGLPVGWEGLGHKVAPLLSVPSPWLLATPCPQLSGPTSLNAFAKPEDKEARAEACR